MSLKNALRHHALSRRRSLLPAQRQRANAAITRRLTALPDFLAATRVLFYVSLGEEVERRALLASSLGKKTVFAPRVEGDRLEIHEISSMDQLQPGAFGILEPVADSPVVDASLVEVALIPGAAFDLRGNRIGYGKGFYDRLLPGVSALKIALAFDRQIVESIPAEPHDIAMDLLVTDERLVDFRKTGGLEELRDNS